MKLPLWILAALGAAVYFLTRGGKDSPSFLTGAGANLAALAKAQEAGDPQSVSLEVGKLAGAASVITAKIKETPSFGTFLGLSPTQIDYIVLPPDVFRTTYGFTADPEPLAPDS